MAKADDLDGMDEIISTIERFIETYQQKWADSIIDHSLVIQTARNQKGHDGLLDENKFNDYLKFNLTPKVAPLLLNIGRDKIVATNGAQNSRSCHQRTSSVRLQFKTH